MPNPADPKAIDISPEAVGRVSEAFSVARAMAMNDDYSRPGTPERDRHVKKMDAMFAADEMIDALSAALSEARGKVGEAEWRPIETVPRGEEIFMAATADGRIMIFRGSILANMMKRSTPDHLQFPAVAWKPLPSPPKDPAK